MDYSNIPPEIIARRIAARYSTNLPKAVDEYIKVLNLNVPVAEAKEQFLGHLPVYLHPVENEDTERMIFHAVFPSVEINGGIGVSCCAAISVEEEEPLTEDEIINGVSGPLQDKILDYMRTQSHAAREYEKIISSYGRSLDMVRNELKQAQKERDALSEKIKSARQAYQTESPGEHVNKRARRVTNVLGLTTGKRKARHTDEELYKLYVELVRRQGKSREGATMSVANTFDLAESTALRRLNTEVGKVKKKWRSEAPLAWPNHKQYLKEFVPFCGDWNP